MRVLILCPYPPGSAPSQRFRFEQYLERLRAREIEFVTETFLDDSSMEKLYRPANYLAKTLSVIRGFPRRIGMLFRAKSFDFIFLHREASPIGPPIIECLLFAMGCKLIYDFDDAIFIPPRSNANPFMPYIRCAWKVDYITRRAHLVSVCNPYLVTWAKARNDNVVLIPTTIDEEYHRPRQGESDSLRPPIIGWTGSHSSARYLDVVRPALAAL